MVDVINRTDIEVVEAFLQAMEDMDIDAALALCTDDVVYQNVPLPPARGRKAFEQQLRFFEKRFTGFEAHNHHIAADDKGAVLTERTDVLIMGRWRSAFWVCGTFEVVDGRIESWTDRFDYIDVTVGFVKGAIRALRAG
ncbi:MAG TPA: limonene-1,2-epoxide hydrolase family protein [Acidimicrobiales bacterium]